MMQIVFIVAALVVAANVLVGVALVVKYRNERRHQLEGSASSVYYADSVW